MLKTQIYTCAECGGPVDVTSDPVTITRPCGHDEAKVYASVSAKMVGKSGMARDAGVQ